MKKENIEKVIGLSNASRTIEGVISNLDYQLQIKNDYTGRGLLEQLLTNTRGVNIPVEEVAKLIENLKVYFNSQLEDINKQIEEID